MPEPWVKFDNAGVRAVRFSSWKSVPMTLMKFRMAITSSDLELPSDVRNAYFAYSALPISSHPFLAKKKQPGKWSKNTSLAFELRKSLCSQSSPGDRHFQFPEAHGHLTCCSFSLARAHHCALNFLQFDMTV